MAAELGPDEGINRLKHPDCRACAEHERLCTGLRIENAQLKKKLAEGGDASEPPRTSQPGESVARAGLGDESGPEIATVIEELERRAKRSDAVLARGAKTGRGWFLGNGFGLREAIALLRKLSTQPVPETAQDEVDRLRRGIPEQVERLRTHQFLSDQEKRHEGAQGNHLAEAEASGLEVMARTTAAQLERLLRQPDCKDHSGKGEGQ